MKFTNERLFEIRNASPTMTEDEEKQILRDQRRLEKLDYIINMEQVGWASPKVLIDTIKREVSYA